jgi:hypothetical protein
MVALEPNWLEYRFLQVIPMTTLEKTECKIEGYVSTD